MHIFYSNHCNYQGNKFRHQISKGEVETAPLQNSPLCNIICSKNYHQNPLMFRHVFKILKFYSQSYLKCVTLVCSMMQRPKLISYKANPCPPRFQTPESPWGGKLSLPDKGQQKKCSNWTWQDTCPGYCSPNLFV